MTDRNFYLSMQEIQREEHICFSLFVLAFEYGCKITFRFGVGYEQWALTMVSSIGMFMSVKSSNTASGWALVSSSLRE